MRPALASILSLLSLVAAGPTASAADAPEAPPPWAKEAEPLLAGVREIAAPGALPGAVVAFGPDAFPLVLGSVGGVRRAPLVAASSLGKGRVVAFGHGGFLGAGAARVADTARFLENAVRWAAAGAKAPRVVVVRSDLEKTLSGLGLDAKALEGGGWTSRLGNADVLVLGEGSPSDDEREAVAAFVRAGGGLVTGLCPWGWMQVTKAPSLAENGLQRLLAPAGLAFSEETLERTGGVGWVVAGPPGRPFHALEAVELLAGTGGKKSKGLDLVQAAVVGQQAVAVLPPDEKRLRPRVRALLRERAAHLVPTEKDPLRADRPLDRFLVAVQVAALDEADPKDVTAHPAAASFPGLPAPGAKAVSRSVPVDLAVPGWHSTGLYARPGQPVRVAVAATTSSSKAPALSVRVGCHSDTLWHLDAWPRVPAITLERRLEGAATTVASAFGGLVYVVVPDGAAGKTTVTIEGAVEAPWFVLGETSSEAWARARRAPGPWAELATSKVVLTVPSEHVRDLADPTPVLRFWDRVLDACADLAGRPHDRARPERYAADVEISAGYMHSGCPIMTHLDAAPRMVDVARLEKDGDWGLFHEMGHNHQAPEWTFDGTGEVTCNLFTLYVLQTVCGKQDVTGHDALADRARKAAEHVRKGAPFAAWKGDPFLALATYVHVIEGFGWEPFRRLFAAYRALPDAERPRSDDDKRDQFLVRLSQKVGRDLGPFFVAWGVPTSAAARARVASLPRWMPPGFPP